MRARPCCCSDMFCRGAAQAFESRFALVFPRRFHRFAGNGGVLCIVYFRIHVDPDSPLPCYGVGLLGPRSRISSRTFRSRQFRFSCESFFEELVVRAYLMTEVMELTGSSALAVALSVGVQFAYSSLLWLGRKQFLCVFLPSPGACISRARGVRSRSLLRTHVSNMYGLIRLCRWLKREPKPRVVSLATKRRRVPPLLINNAPTR